MIVEMLTFAVKADERAGWLAADARTWTRFLQIQEGFVRKETWIDPEHPDVVRAMIWWADDDSMRRIPAAAMRAINEAMGTWYRPSSMRRAEVVTPE